MSKINIRKRNKYYEYRIEIAKVDDKRKWISKSGFKTKQEAEEAGIQAYNEYLSAGVPFKSCNMSYSDYLDYWMENYCKNNLKYNTINTYEIIIRKYLKPFIGRYKLSTITSVALNNFMNNIVNNYNHSRNYYKNILKVLKGSFRDACNLYGFIKYNPALTLRLPKIEQYSEDVKHVYTEEEIKLILERFKDNITFICAFLTAYFTGLRTGEVFAITWDDIDLKEGIISVKNSVYDKPKDYKGRWYLGTTKTKTGVRKIYIGNILKEVLKSYKKRQEYLKEIYGSQYKYYYLEDIENDNGKVIEKRIVLTEANKEIINLIFTKDDGTYVGTDITKYPYKVIHNELEIKKCRFYDLRGTFATKLASNGALMQDVSDLMGHTDPTITQKYYISSNEDSKKEAINNLDETLKNIDIINFKK
ncbi:MAG: site-specific integrase [Mollicutes bacterium]|nr:site-specific integrase [Mollicutes bacterium]